MPLGLSREISSSESLNSPKEPSIMKSKNRYNRSTNHPDLKTTIHRFQALLSKIETLLQVDELRSNTYPCINKKGRRFRFSDSNRIKFQNKLKMSKLGSSPSLLSQEGRKFHCPHAPCPKTYKLEGALRTHVRTVHGGEDATLLNETKFDPQETSTSAMVMEDRKRKRSMTDNQRPEESESESDDEENLEEAVKAKESRRKTIDQLNVERDLEMGYDVEDSMIGVPSASTQSLLGALVDTVEQAQEDVKSASQRRSINVIEEVLNLSDGDNNNLDVIKEKEARIKLLERMVEDKDSKIVDLQVIQQEMSDQLDGKDRVIKEKRSLIKLKQEEIDELVKDKHENINKMKKSPLKESLKKETVKAQRQITLQQVRLRTLEAQNDELSREVKRLEKERPDLGKLKKTAADCVDRAQHFDRERAELEDKIAGLKKKIPCSVIARCDMGKKCQYSHVLKYVNDKAVREKKIPCIHFINNRCKYDDDDCAFSHSEQFMTGKQRRAYLDARRELDVIEEEEDELNPGRGQYSRSADRYKPLNTNAKKRRVNYTREDDSDATANYPDPVYAGSSRRSSRSSRASSPRNTGRDSGNERGARGSRPNPVSPMSGRGSSRGSSKDGGRNNPRSRKQDQSPPRRQMHRRQGDRRR